MNVNSVCLTGNCTRDPELKEAGSTSVCELGLAVNERVKKGDDWEDYASYFDIVVWGKQGEACAKYLSKGSRVAVQGRLKQDRWEKDGEKRNKVRVIASVVQFPPKSESSGGSTEDSGTDGLPF